MVWLEGVVVIFGFNAFLKTDFIYINKQKSHDDDNVTPNKVTPDWEKNDLGVSCAHFHLVIY